MCRSRLQSLRVIWISGRSRSCHQSHESRHESLCCGSHLLTQEYVEVTSNPKISVAHITGKTRRVLDRGRGSACIVLYNLWVVPSIFPLVSVREDHLAKGQKTQEADDPRPEACGTNFASSSARAAVPPGSCSAPSLSALSPTASARSPTSTSLSPPTRNVLSVLPRTGVCMIGHNLQDSTA